MKSEKIKKGAFIRKDMVKQATFLSYVEDHYREITGEDRFKMDVDVLVIKYKNNPPRHSFEGYEQCKADIGNVGKTYADVFVKAREPYAIRVGIKSCRVWVLK